MTNLKEELQEKQDIRGAIAWFKLHDVEAYTDDDNGFYVVITHELNSEDIHVLVSPLEVSYRADLWDEFKSKTKKHGDI